MGKKKRIGICHAEVPNVYGGAEIHIEQLRYHLQQKGLKVDMITIPFKNSPKAELYHQMDLWRDLKVKDKYDLVICTRFPSYGIRHPNKVTWLIHQYRGVYDLFNTPFSRYKLEDPDDLSLQKAIMEFDETSLTECINIYTNSLNTANRLKVFNDISGMPLYHPPKLANQFYHECYGNYILSVGRLDKLKRVNKLIKAMKKTSEKVKCIIVGTGPEEKKLKQLAYECGVDNRVRFLGFVNDRRLLDLYANCFAVYYAPYDEDYGYVTLETFLSKKPIITGTDSGGVLEFVKNKTNGFVEMVKSHRIAAKIETLYNDRKTLCSQFGENGYSTVKKISWDGVIEKLTQTLK